MPDERFPEHPLDLWQAQTLRVTAFPAPAPSIASSTWWEDLMNNSPETRVSQPRRGTQEDVGPLGEGRLILRVDPIRIDWLYTIRENHKLEIEGWPIIGSFPDTLETFLPLINHWFTFGTCPNIQRLAFGAVLLQPTETRAEGYYKLSSYLHAVKLDPEGSSDFQYQINRRRDSTGDVPELRINRLSKWSVAATGIGNISVGPGVTKFSRVPLNFACLVEIDMNTVQEFPSDLPRERIPQIFRELVTLGREIAKQGDVP